MALPEDPPRANLTPTQMRQGIRRLQYRRSEVEGFDFGEYATDPRRVARPLRQRVTETFAKVFGDGTNEHIKYANEVKICWSLFDKDPSASFIPIPDRYFFCLLGVLNEAASFLSEELDVATTGHPQEIPAAAGARPDSGRSTSAVLGSKVFIVHGHDDAALHAVARFISEVGLTPIILREQPSQGRTIIEKFEDCAEEVGFAVVIMTPDDIVTEPSSATRARQNVIYELGYFTGKLRARP